MSYLSIKGTNGRKSEGFLGHGDLPHTHTYTRNWWWLNKCVDSFLARVSLTSLTKVIVLLFYSVLISACTVTLREQPASISYVLTVSRPRTALLKKYVARFIRRI